MTPFHSQFDDFTSLALSDHLIMTQGTFGWWAAWFIEQRAKYDNATSTWSIPQHNSTVTTKSDPDILFYKYPYWKNTFLGDTFVTNHFYPENWKAYTNYSIDTQHHVLCNSTDARLCFRWSINGWNWLGKNIHIQQYFDSGKVWKIKLIKFQNIDQKQKQEVQWSIPSGTSGLSLMFYIKW